YSPAPAPQRQAIPTVGTPARGGRHAIGSGFTPDEGDESYGYNAPPPKPDESEDQTSWSDYAKNTWNAVRGTAAQFAGLGEYISREITGDSTLSKQIGAIRDGLNSDIQNSISSMTPAAQNTLRASFMSYLGGDTDKDGNHVPTPGEVGFTRYF